jgi:protein-S-isoprenylcysteine O-methyltransferase Ste14
MSEPTARKAASIAFPIIVLVVLTLFGASYVLSSALGLPSSLGLPVAARAVGGVVVVAGLTLMGWVFSYRRPSNVIVSTYITFAKIFRKVPLAERAGRTEPLVISGPQKYVRSPLYLGVIVMVLGWAILSSSTFVFVATVVLLLWFGLVLIPFEERELKALFGEQWVKYVDETPMLIPLGKRKSGSN